VAAVPAQWPAVKTTFYCSLLREPLLPSSYHVAKRCNMPATIQQEGCRQSIRKQPENLSYVRLDPVLKSFGQRGL